MNRILILLIFLTITEIASSQEGDKLDKILQLPTKAFAKIEEKTEAFDNSITRATEKYLEKLRKQEQKLYGKLYKKDSTAAKQLFGNIDSRYGELKQELNKPLGSFNSLSNQYNGHLDSLNTSVNFLRQQGAVDGINNSISQGTLEKISALQGKLNASDRIKKAIQQRKKMLQERLQQLGFVKEFHRFKKQVYYYQQQLAEYKSLFENPAKLEKQLMQWAMKIPAFQEFFANHSQLGNLFSLPGRSTYLASIAGLQTRASVQQELVSRFGAGPDVQQLLQQGMGEAQGMLNDIKNRMQAMGSSGSDAELPDFKTNTQKTKSLFKRIELGTNFQSQRATSYFPHTTDLGLSIGYRLNDKSVIGIGSSYKLGLGRGWNNIRVTGEGVSLRTFIDLKIKGSFWVSGGYEQHYRSAFNSVAALRDKNAWQQSGLIGISKVVSLKTKFFKKTKVQLLWDFLSGQQEPVTQPLQFRIGYSFK